jgi:vancomycin resistance protein YoaR
MPGESFSLNEKTGLRSNDKGYKPAGAILNGKLVPELGGGVCQVSTTLFNAVVRAGVEITERNNHSYPISYVPRGMDAMIDYQSAKDFRFVNNSSGPIYLVSHFSNQELTVEVYGQPILDEGIAVELRSETTEEIPMPPTIYETDYTLMPGEMVEERTGRTGYRVTTYIQYKRGETVEKEDVLFKSVYTAYAPIVKQGPLPADGSIGYYDPSTDTPILPSGDIPILQ